jgi:hypothetical protein
MFDALFAYLISLIHRSAAHGAMEEEEKNPTKVPLARFGMRTCRMQDGERIPLGVNQVGIPVELPNKRLVVIRRPHLQFNSHSREARVVAHTYEWAARSQEF